MRPFIQLLVLLASRSALADVFMHNPRGSNDRNCERNVNRDNENRLFDSQNNNAGGYACPRGDLPDSKHEILNFVYIFF